MPRAHLALFCSCLPVRVVPCHTTAHVDTRGVEPGTRGQTCHDQPRTRARSRSSYVLRRHIECEGRRGEALERGSY